GGLGIDVENFLSVVAPARTCTPINRDPLFSAWTWKSRYVDLVSLRFIGAVRHPVPIRGELAVHFGERSAIQKHCGHRRLPDTFGSEGQFPDMTSCLSTGRKGIHQKELAIGRATRRRIRLPTATALPKQLLGSSQVRCLSIDVLVTFFGGEKDDALATPD